MSELFTKAGVVLSQVCEGAQMVGPQPARVTGCTSHWRQVQPGDVYVALVEADFDGHDHAAKAALQGAAVIVCERQLPLFGVTQCIVDDSRVAFGKICQALAGNPCNDLSLVGVTGSAGKSCVAALLESILATAGVQTGVLSSLENYDGCQVAAPRRAPLNQPMLAHWLSRMAANGCSHGIVELAAHELAQARTAGIALELACITNVFSDQRGRLATAENYGRTKERILEYLQPHGVAVLNADDPVCCRMLSTLDQPVLTFGMHQPAEVTATIVEQFVGEQTFLLAAGEDAAGVRTSIVGEHHVSNCLAAATLGLAYGVDLTTIARGLESVQRIPGRMDRIVCGQPFGIWVDAADSPPRLRACLKSVRRVTKGKVYCAFQPRTTGSFAQQETLWKALHQYADETIICGREVAISMPTRQVRVAGLADTVAHMIGRAKPDDGILIAGGPGLGDERAHIEAILYDSLGSSLTGGVAA